jgi:hypothetical protein
VLIINRREKLLLKEEKIIYKRYKMEERSFSQKIGNKEPQQIKRNRLLRQMMQ